MSSARVLLTAESKGLELTAKGVKGDSSPLEDAKTHLKDDQVQFLLVEPPADGAEKRVKVCQRRASLLACDVLRTGRSDRVARGQCQWYSQGKEWSPTR